MKKLVSIFLSLLIVLNPAVYACENIEPIDPKSVEYDPKTWLKNALAEEGRLEETSLQRVGRSIANTAREFSPALTALGYAGDIYYVVSSSVDLADAILKGDIEQEVISSINLVAAFAIPAISTVNPIVGIAIFAVLAEAQAIYALVEESEAYHRLLNQLDEYGQQLQEQINEIEQKMLDRIQTVALKQRQLHEQMSDQDSLGYRVANLRVSQEHVVPQIQDTVDSAVSGLIEFELKPYMGDSLLEDIPHLSADDLFHTVTEMEVHLSLLLNELTDIIETASFASNDGFLDQVNTKVIEGVEQNLLGLLPPLITELLENTNCPENLREFLDYSVGEYGRKEFLTAHLGSMEELAWLYFLYYFVDNPDALGGLTDPAVAASVVAASAWIPIVGLVLLATAAPAIGSKLLADDQEVVREIFGMRQFIEYCSRLEASILGNSDRLSLAIEEFVDSQVHPFVSSQELKQVMRDAINYARGSVLVVLPHAENEENIKDLEINDAYTKALANIEALKVSENSYIRFVMDADLEIEPTAVIYRPKMEKGESDKMMIHFDDSEGETLEMTTNLGSDSWSTAATESPHEVSLNNNNTAFFRINPSKKYTGDGSKLKTLSISTQAVSAIGDGGGSENDGGGTGNEDNNFGYMPGSITKEDDQITVEMFVNGNANYHDSVVVPYLTETINETLDSDFEEYIRSIADPVSHEDALHWLDDAKDEGIEEAAIKEGLRITAGLIAGQIGGFLKHDHRDKNAFDDLADNIDIHWSLIEHEIVARIEGEPVDYYKLNRIPGAEYLVDQFTEWARNMSTHIESNGWRHLDQFPDELVDFVAANEIEREAVEKMYLGTGIQLRSGSHWYNRSSRSRIAMGAFPMEVMRDYATRVGGLDAASLRGPFYQYKYNAVLEFDDNWNYSHDMGSWRPPVNYELEDGSTQNAGWVGHATVTENVLDAMWPQAFHAMARSGNHSIYRFPSTRSFHVELYTGELKFVDGNGNEASLGYYLPNLLKDYSSSGGWGLNNDAWNVGPAEIKIQDSLNPRYKSSLGYEPKLKTSLNFIRLEDDSRFRGFEVELDLNLAEFIWMTTRRDYNHTQLEEVKVRVHSVMHQRYAHNLPHEGDGSSTKTIDRDIYCMEERVIMNAAELDAYRSGTLPAALTEPITFSHFNNSAGLPSHGEFEITNQRSYAELKCIELIFDGDTRYIFKPAPGDVFTDGSSSNGATMKELPMYFFHPEPAHPAQIKRFNNYTNQDLTGLELPIIIKGFQ